LNETSPAPFAIEVSQAPSALRVELRGEANMDGVEALAAALDGTHTRALADGSDRVIVDLTQLEFMSSTCFKKVLGWIGKVAAMVPPPYVIHFVSDPRIGWQNRSLHALVAFAPGVVTLEKT
jgi:hypothetical protein